MTRDSARSPLTLPYAITATVPDSVRPGMKHTSLDEFLSVVPGVIAVNRQNPAQDPRLSIRGFGARSAFGVRGVRVLWEGIPLTAADGQTPVDFIDLDAVTRIEVLRGSASSLFGNASGGVVSLSAESDTGSYARIRQTQEVAGLRRSGMLVGTQHETLTARGSINRTSGQGFRDYSRVVATRSSALLSGVLGLQRWRLHLSAFDMPVAENPGSITEAQLKTDARQADALSVRKRAGKSVTQQQAALSVSHVDGSREFSALIFGGARALVNPLTFATVNLDRSSGGFSSRAAVPLWIGNFIFSINGGVDIQLQNDDRRELENCSDSPVSARCPLAAAPTGAVRRTQREVVRSIGGYLRSETAVGSRMTVSVAGRHDLLHFRVFDRMPVATAQRQSGTRLMSATSPMTGVVFRAFSAASLYANISTAFETPTVTELANKPDGSTGLNATLRPQVSRTFEAGTRGIFRSGIRYDIAVHASRVRDELIPFEIAGGAGRRFFRNAGRTDRAGLEAFLAGASGPAEWSVAYTASRFLFADYVVNGTSYAGNRIPGIPGSKLDAALTLKHRRGFLTVETTSASPVFVDDLNSSRSSGYNIVNLRTGGMVTIRAVAFRPAIGMTNLLDRRYSASINTNAAGGKYYEPGSQRLLYGMLQIESRF